MPEYWSGLPCPPPEDLPKPGIEPRSPAWQVDSLPSESPEKPKDTGVGSVSLLQQIFPTQEFNQSLLHCRQILYQLSYQGIPIVEDLPHLPVMQVQEPTCLICSHSVNLYMDSLVAQLVKNPPAMQETLVQFLGQEDPLEKG